MKRCSDLVYAAQRSDGYEMSRFGSYLSALSVHEKKDNEMKRLAEVGAILLLVHVASCNGRRRCAMRTHASDRFVFLAELDRRR